MTAEWPLMTITFTPDTRDEWILALRHAPYGTVLADCDGDIWTKLGGPDGYNWLRTHGGWASAEEVADYAPFREPPIGSCP
jgi:hypothetical protein